MSNKVHPDPGSDKMAYYLSEYRRHLERLKHIRHMLDVLSEESKGLRRDIRISKNLFGQVAASTFDNALPSSPSKRGRKSKWGNFIVHRLKQEKKPLTYDDLLKDAIQVFGLKTEDEIESVRKIIFSTSFRLKSKEDVLRTFSVKGRRGKYLALNKWCTPGGKLKKEFALMIVDDHKDVK